MAMGKEGEGGGGRRNASPLQGINDLAGRANVRSVVSRGQFCRGLADRGSRLSSSDGARSPVHLRRPLDYRHPVVVLQLIHTACQTRRDSPVCVVSGVVA